MIVLPTECKTLVYWGTPKLKATVEVREWPQRYRERTEPFWQEGQAAWEEIIATRDRFTLRAAPDQGQLFTPLLEYAEKLYDGAALEPVTARTLARETVGSYLAGSRGQ